jgi:deazaflavin-dependent oxidoreductase (nitroreductase family)
MIEIANLVLKRLLWSPLHHLGSKRLLLLTFRGRKTGKAFTTPVSYVQVGETVLIGTERAWKENLRGGVRVGLWLRGERRMGRAEVLDDEAGMRECYREMLANNPGYGRFIGVTLNEDGQPDPDAVRRARDQGLVVVRVHLEPVRAGA